MNDSTVPSLRDTDEVIEMIAEDHRRYAVARFKASGKACEVFQRIPLHVFDMPDEKREWELGQIADKLKRRVVMRRRLEAAHARC